MRNSKEWLNGLLPSCQFIAMTTEQKIQAAYERINQLQILVRHWKASQASSKSIALELIQGVVSEDYETEVA